MLDPRQGGLAEGLVGREMHAVCPLVFPDDLFSSRHAPIEGQVLHGQDVLSVSSSRGRSARRDREGLLRELDL